MCDRLFLFGNCLHRKPGIASEDFVNPVGEDLWVVGQPEIAPSGLIALTIRGHRVPLVPHDDPWPHVELCRSLVPTHRELLFATEAEIRGRLPADLPLFLQLEEWHHPDVMGGDLPSKSSTFQMIAEVLETGDRDRYKPVLPPNTHWSNWPEGGAM